MSYYCIITGVNRKRVTGFEVTFELRVEETDQPVADNDGAITRRMGLEFPTTGTRAERIDDVRIQLEAHFQSVIDRVLAGDNAYSELDTLLTGRRYPEAS